MLLAPPLPAEPATQAQIEAVIDKFQSQRLDAAARKQGWQGMAYTLQNDLPRSVEQLAVCQQAPQVELLSPSKQVHARLFLRISCATAPEWSLEATSQASIYLSAVVAATVIERGQSIAPSDLRIEKIDLLRTQRGYYKKVDELRGMIAKRRVRAGQALNPGLIAPPVLVQRGQQVKIIASHEGIQASMVGEAQENGHQGQVIRVKNLTSKKVIDAKILEAGVVTSTID